MLQNYLAKYIEIPSGYMGQLVEWPEIVTEGKTLAECRESLADALQETIAAYRQVGKEIPIGRFLMEAIAVEV
ncbi:MAG: type II toxin-antitoxin system HicB family antitoxin [Candidatus Binatia bacterium]